MAQGQVAGRGEESNGPGDWGAQGDGAEEEGWQVRQRASLEARVAVVQGENHGVW